MRKDIFSTIDTPRVNIGSLAIQLRAEGPNSQESEISIPERYDIDSSRTKLNWDVVKPELYALTAVILERVIRRVYAERRLVPPYGLLERDLESPERGYHPLIDLGSENPYKKLGESMAETLHFGLVRELRDLEDLKNQDVPLKKTYERLKELLPYRLPTKYHAKTPHNFIVAGINTAADVMQGILGVIPEVYERENPNEELEASILVNIVKNSFPLVAELAMGHEKMVVPTIFEFKGSDKNYLPFNPNYFELEMVGNSSRLIISKVKLKEVLGSGSEYLNLGPTVGCPAMVNFRGDSVVRKLWNWHIEIAGKIYQDLYPTTK